MFVYNGYNEGWPSAGLFGWSATDWSRPATMSSFCGGFNWQVVEDSIGLVCCRLGELVGWAAREEREELFLGAACVLCSLFCSAVLVLLAPGFVRLSQPLVPCFQTGASYTFWDKWKTNFWRLLFALLQNKRSLLHLFHVSSSFCFFYLARCGFRLLPNFRLEMPFEWCNLTLP